MDLNTGANLEHWLNRCLVKQASDLHIAPNQPAYFRIHGRLIPATDEASFSPSDTVSLARQLCSIAGRAMPESGSVDGAITSQAGSRFRFNVFRRQSLWSIAIRKLEDRFRTLSELGLPESLYSLCELPDGLIVVAGPTGSGKSTTLATLIDRMNQNRECHIVTVEDPIEYQHSSIRSLVNQRQVGIDVESFNEALVSSLRQDPDVILVGEIRDLATIRTAITAAETGHLVLTTVHAGDCVGAIERLIAVFPAEEQLGMRRMLGLVLRAIITQHLVTADGPNAKQNTSDNRRNRVVTSEILMVNPAVANLISTGKSNQIYSSMETGTAQGMQTLEHDLARLWITGWLDENTVTALARNPGVMRDRATQLRKTGLRPGAVPR